MAFAAQASAAPKKTARADLPAKTRQRAPPCLALPRIALSIPQIRRNINHNFRATSIRNAR
jgi:hypothetical protein